MKYWVSLTLLFLLSLPAVTTRIYASDEIEYFAYLRSLWFDRDVSFDNEYRHIYDTGIARPAGFHETFLEGTTETGRRINFATMGCALLWSPFYAVADLATRARRAAGGHVAADGYSPPYIKAVAYASAFYGALSVALSILICQRLRAGVVEPGFSLLSANAAPDQAKAWSHEYRTWRRGYHLTFLAPALVWAGTPLIFYMYVTPPMAHAASAFASALFILAWLRARERWRITDVALLAALGALMGMVREQDLFLAIGPLADYGWDLMRRRKEAVQALGLKVTVAAATFAVVYLPQALAYLALNGRIGPSQLVSRKMMWTAPHALEVLISREHGFFWWTPLAVIAIAGLLAMTLGQVGRVGQVGRAGQVGRVGPALPMLLMIAAQIYVNGSVDSWTQAGAFGQRRFVAVSPLLAAGLYGALLWLGSAARPWRLAGAIAIGLAIWWNLALIVQFGAGLMDRQRLQLSVNAHHAFVTVPRQLPGILYRYLFERGSFYKPTASLWLPPSDGRKPQSTQSAQRRISYSCLCGLCVLRGCLPAEAGSHEDEDL